MFGFLIKEITGQELLELICLVTAKSWEENKQGKDTFEPRAMSGLLIMLSKKMNKKISAKHTRELLAVFHILVSTAEDNAKLYDSLLDGYKKQNIGESDYLQVREILSLYGLNYL